MFSFVQVAVKYRTHTLSNNVKLKYILTVELRLCHSDVYFFYLPGDRHPLCSLALKTTRPTDESREPGDHRASGAGVWVYKCSGVQVLEEEQA